MQEILRERDHGGFTDRNDFGSRMGGGMDVSLWEGGREEERETGSGISCLGTKSKFVCFFKHMFPTQIPVPRHSVGVVIGRNGEMIKKIQNDAGVRIQFKQGDDFHDHGFHR